MLSTSELQEVCYSRMSGRSVDTVWPCGDRMLLGVADISAGEGQGGGGGGGGGVHSSPALSHIKVEHVEHVDVTICEIFTRVFGTNVGA